MKIVELGGAPGPRYARDPIAAAELRRLLARPLAPLAELDRRDRRKITAPRLAGLAAALAEVRPAWIGEYAASTVIALPLRERRLREFMLHELFQSQRDPAQALGILAKQLHKLPEGKKVGIVTALLGSLAVLSAELKPATFEDVERELQVLVRAMPPPTSAKMFAQLALNTGQVAQRLSGISTARPPAADRMRPVNAIAKHLDEPHRGLLQRSRWGALAPEINSLLWHQLWRRWRPAPAETPPAFQQQPAPQPPTQQSLLTEAAWSEADQALARALQDASRLMRSLDKLEASGEEMGQRTASTRGAANLVLQWVRQAGRLRNLECLGAFGSSAEFDPEFHESDDAAPGEPVRIVKPPVVRRTGAGQIVVLRGEVELE
jgi:hypothetical protein